MKREYSITVEEYLVEMGVRGFGQAVTRFSTEYQAFQRGELEEVVVGAAGDCWSFQDREIQLKRSFPVTSLGRGKTVMLRESFLNAEKEDELGKALHDWEVKGCFGLIESMMGLEVALKRLVFAVCVITGVESVPDRWTNIDLGEDMEFDCLESFVKGYGTAETLADAGVVGFDRVMQVLDAVQRRLFVHCAARSSGKTIALLCMRDIRDDFYLSEQIVRSTEDEHSVVKSLVAVAEERKDVLYNGSSVMKVLGQLGGGIKSNSNTHGQGTQGREFSRSCAVLAGYISMASPGGVEAVLFLEKQSQRDREIFLSYVALVTQCDRASVKQNLLRRCGKKNTWDVHAKEIMEWMWNYDIRQVDGFVIDNLLYVLSSRNMAQRVCSDGDSFQIEWLMLYLLLARVSDAARVQDPGSSTLPFDYSTENMTKACMYCWNCLLKTLQNSKMRKMLVDVFHTSEPPNATVGPLSRFATYLIKSFIGSALLVVMLEDTSSGEMGDVELRVVNLLIQLASDTHVKEAIFFVSHIIDADMNNEDSCIQVLEKLKEVLGLCFSVAIETFEILEKEIGKKLSRIEREFSSEEDEVNAKVGHDDFTYLCRMLVLVISMSDFWSEKGHVSASMFKMIEQITHTILCSMNLSATHAHTNAKVLVQTLNMYRHLVSASQRTTIFEVYLKESSQYEHFFILCLWLLFSSTEDQITLKDKDEGSILVSENDLQDVANRLLQLQEGIGNIQSLGIMTIVAAIYCRWRSSNDMLASIIDSELIAKHLVKISENATCECSSVPNILKTLKSEDQAINMHVKHIYWFLIPEFSVHLNPMEKLYPKTEEGDDILSDIAEEGYRESTISKPSKIELTDDGSFEGVFEFILDNLKLCEESLGKWSKRREKDDLLEFSQHLRENRDEDIPPVIGNMQSHLWSLSNDVQQEIDEAVIQIRQLVCTKYEPFDEKSVAETSAVLDHGEILQPQLKDHNFDEKIKCLRQSITKTTIEALRSKYITLAALDLYQLEYFSASVSIFSQDQSNYLLADLVTLLVEAILFGRSPILGSSSILDLLESLLGYERLEMDRNRRNDIVSLAARSLQGLGRGSPLEPSIGVRLLDILLEPDSMLDTDNLEDFREILYHVCHLAGGNFDSNLSIILTNFDTNRFGTLAAQRTLESDQQTFRTMASGSKTTQFMSLVLELAQWCLKHPVTSSVGVSILEGILSASMERYFCVCLSIVFSRRSFNGKPIICSRLKEVAAICQSTNVAVESFRILSSAFFDSSGDSLGILSAFLKSPAFSNSVGSDIAQNSIGWTSSLAPDGEVCCELVQLGNPDTFALVDALNSFVEVYLNSTNVSGVEHKIIVEQNLNALLSSLHLPRLVEDHSSWGAPWVWKLYRDIMSPHIKQIDKQYENLGSDVLQSYWDRIPWQLSSFHLDEQVASLQDIRSSMCFSVFPLSLLLRADWSPFLEVVREGNRKKLNPSTIAEGGMVIMYLAISVPDWQLPGWLLDEKGELNIDFLQKIIILIDWNYIKDQVVPMRREKPHSWILSPIVSTIASGTREEVSTRLKRTLMALSAASSSPETDQDCFDVVLQTLTDVLGFSLCSIVQTSSASILPSQSDKMVVPDDIPLELLEGTMEMEQIKIQNADNRHLQRSNAVELRSCFRLSVSDHVDIVQSLVSMVQSALDDEESMSKKHQKGPIWNQSQFSGSIITWVPSSSNFTTIYSKAADLTCASTVVEALLLALASDPITLMTTEPVPFGSTDPPWFTGDRLFTNLSNTEKVDGKYSLKRLMRGISHMGSNGSHPAPLNTVNDMESLRIYLYKTIEDKCIQNDAPNFLSRLGRASLRDVLLCDSLERIPHAHEFAEGILRQALLHTSPPPISGNTIEEDDSIQMDAFYPENVSIDRFLGLAHIAAATECPLLSTFLLKQAFHRSTTIEKSEWQFTITKVLQTVKVGKKLTMESVLLWLHLLDWLNDPRWRRLPPGSHNDSLNLFLKYLDAVVSHLQQAECSKGRIGTKIARKVSQNIRQHLSSPQQEVSSPGHAETRAPIHPEKYDTHTIMERDGSGSLYEIPLASSHDMSEDEFASSSSTTGTRRQKVMKGFKAFGRQMSNIGNKITKAAGSQTKQPSTTLADHQDDATSAPENPTPSNQYSDGFDIHLNDVAPIGLAAYAISAYIRTVMEPKLARRTRSADAGSMGHPTIRHIKGTSTLSGSRQMEEEQLLELDTLLSARSELDVLNQLKNCSCVTQHALVTEPFFDRMPQLLHVQVSVDDFKVGLISSLITDPISNRVFHLAFLT